MGDRPRPEDQVIPEPTKGRRVPWPYAVGRTGAADQRNPGDSKGQQETTDVEVSGRFAATGLDGNGLERAFTAMISSGGRGSGLTRVFTGLVPLP